MAEGYIKLYKKMLEWGWYDDNNTKILFLHCLLKANWKETSWHGIKIEPGQFVTSLPSLAEETHLSIKQVRVALKHLVATGEVADKGQAKCRIITIKNWCEYQGEGRQRAGKGQAKGRQGASAKEIKNKEIKKYKYYEDARLNDAFQNFVDMRQRIRKPMSDNAIELAKKKLDKLSGGDTDTAVAILNQSIFGSWTGLYELKEKDTAAEKSGGNTRTYTSDFFKELEKEAIGR